jgi:arsenite-transporting ATPase
LVLNAVLPDNEAPSTTGTEAGKSDPVTRAWFARQRGALTNMPAAISQLPRLTVPMLTGDLTGLDALRELASGAAIDAALDAAAHVSTTLNHPDVDAARLEPASPLADHAESLASFDDLIASLAHESHGAILTMGKGGVGKTTVARRVAIALAERGLPVHLSTTDPAGGEFASTHGHPTLRVSRIDAAAEIAAYTDEVMRAAGPLDTHERELLAEDLRSPCTEEIAVFRAFARILADAQNEFVVLDTAPTGHTILLLDAAQAYHREVAKSTGAVPPEVAALLPRLRDPAFTRVLVVSLAEFTPVAEAERLVEDLARAGITPYGWVVNGLLSQTDVQHPLLRARAAQEAGPLARAARASTRIWGLPWQPIAGELMAALDDVPDDAPDHAPGARPSSPGALALQT